MTLSRNMKVYSDAQEKLVCNYLGWDQVTASGARPFYPGDVISECWLGECKTHEKHERRIAFHAATWEKIQTEAMSKMRQPLYVVDNGTQTIEGTWVLISEKFVTDYIVRKFGQKPVKSRTLSFDHQSLYKETEGIICQVYEWRKWLVAVMPLKTFKLMLES
jgi:hypothetical protein